MVADDKRSTTNEHYNFYNVTSLLPAEVQFYWQQLAQADTIQMRFPDIENPQWLDVEALIKDHYRFMYYIIDLWSNTSVNRIAGEFQMVRSVGRSLQLHFSTRPDLSLNQRVIMVLTVSKTLLRNKNISSLFGIVGNRAAFLLLRKAGWNAHGRLKGAIKHYDGTFSDARIMSFQ